MSPKDKFYNGLKAIVFDRDATLNDMATERLYYVLTPEQVKLHLGVKEFLKLMRSKGILPFVFTQQNCISKGLLTENELSEIHNQFQDLLGKEAQIEAFYYAPDEDSPFAKPNPNMLLKILSDYKLKPEEVLVVGDSERDYKSAQNAGLNFIFMKHGDDFEPDATPPIANSFKTLRALLDF